MGRKKVQIIALEQIPYKPWLQERIQRNMELISQSKTVWPIELSYDKKNQTYQLKDGNHRCHVAKLLGYTHIPAVVGRPNKSQPYPNNVMEKWHMADEVEQLIRVDEQKTEFSQHRWFVQAIDETKSNIEIIVTEDIDKPLVIHVCKVKKNVYNFSHGSSKLQYDRLDECICKALRE